MLCVTTSKGSVEMNNLEMKTIVDHFMKEINKELVQMKEIKEELIEKEKKVLSQFELSIVRCCSVPGDTDVARCFELNGFGGVNFLVSPCNLLKYVKKAPGILARLQECKLLLLCLVLITLLPATPEHSTL